MTSLPRFASFSTLSRLALAAWLSFFFAACQAYRPLQPDKPFDKKPEEPVLYEWHGDDSIKGPPSIRVNLTEQKAYFYRGNTQVAWTYVTTGRAGHRTPTGKFRIIEKAVDKYSNRYGVIKDRDGNVLVPIAKVGREKIPKGADFEGFAMPYWMRLTNYGIGLHAGPIPQPGATASHGCIRLPRPVAERIFNEVSIGTPVYITGTAP